jgi:hypothetical protein
MVDELVLDAAATDRVAALRVFAREEVVAPAVLVFKPVRILLLELKPRQATVV